MTHKSRTRRWISRALKLVVAVLLLGWLTTSGRLDFSPLLQASLSPLHLVGFPLVALSNVPSTMRWRWLLRIQGVDAGFRQVLTWLWIGEFFALTLPGSMGAELARGFYVVRNTERDRLGALSTLLLDRVLGLFAALFLGSLSFAVSLLGDDPPDAALTVVGVAVTLLLLAVGGFSLGVAGRPTRALMLRLVPKRFSDSVETVLSSYLAQKWLLARCFVLSLVPHLLLMLAFMVAGEMLGTPLQWHQVLLVVPLVLIAIVLPISPGGIGVGETAASVLFAQLGAPNGAAIMLLVRVWLILLQLCGGLVYLASSGNAGSHSLR